VPNASPQLSPRVPPGRDRLARVNHQHSQNEFCWAPTTARQDHGAA
jgi:hypothetical protein